MREHLIAGFKLTYKNTLKDSYGFRCVQIYCTQSIGLRKIHVWKCIQIHIKLSNLRQNLHINTHLRLKTFLHLFQEMLYSLRYTGRKLQTWNFICLTGMWKDCEDSLLRTLTNKLFNCAYKFFKVTQGVSLCESKWAFHVFC